MQKPGCKTQSGFCFWSIHQKISFVCLAATNPAEYIQSQAKYLVSPYKTDNYILFRISAMFIQKFIIFN
jgi:hypothetical protein